MSNLCLGGSFNPIHHGHLICARAAAETLGLSTVVLIPSGQPPHKCASLDVVAAHHRLAMCRLAVQGHPHFSVDDREIHRAGPSYTIDTARQLSVETGEPTHWLVGADQFMTLPTWHEPQALLREVRFVILARPGWQLDWQALPRAFRALQAAVVPAPLVGISATQIRQRVAEEKPIDFLTPPSVVRYIHDHGIYGGVERRVASC